jgi:hypothetical protein
VPSLRKILGGTYSIKNWGQEALFLNSDGVIDDFFKRSVKSGKAVESDSKAIDAILMTVLAGRSF